MTRLQTFLQQLAQTCRKEPLTLGDLFSEAAIQDQAVISLVSALPFLLPIPLPGLSMPFGALIAWTAVRMFLGKPFWIPAFLRNKIIPNDKAIQIFEKLSSLSRFISKWIKPRGSFFTKVPGMKRTCFLLISICGLLLALPLPPGTNAPPALTASLLSIGVLEHDDLYLLLGLVCFFLILVLFVYIPLVGYPHVIQWFGY